MKRSRVGHQENKRHVVIVMPETRIGDETQGSKADETAMLKTLSPLTTSMRIFGLFFLKDNENDASNIQPNQSSRWSLPKFSSKSHVYAFAVLMAMWLNMIRFATVFSPYDKPASDLIWKLIVFVWMLMCTLAQTSCYRACSSGRMLVLLRSFNKKFTPDWYKCIQRNVILCAIVAWIFVTNNFVFVGYVHYSSNENAMDISLAPVRTLVFPDRNMMPFFRTLFMVVHFYLNGAGNFPVIFNLFIATVFSHQFTICNRKFRKSIENSVSFEESFEDLRRQHQMLSRLVSKADNFICVSNATYVSCLIFLVIATLYNLIWNRSFTSAPILLFMSIFWLAWSVFLLSMVSYGGIIVNHAAHKIYERIHDIDLKNLSAETIGQINTFLNRLCGEPIGFSVLNIFVIDRSTILTITGMLITYFLLIVQLVPPSSDSQGNQTSTQNTTLNVTLTSQVEDNFTTSFL